MRFPALLSIITLAIAVVRGRPVPRSALVPDTKRDTDVLSIAELSTGNLKTLELQHDATHLDTLRNFPSPRDEADPKVKQVSKCRITGITGTPPSAGLLGKASGGAETAVNNILGGADQAVSDFFCGWNRVFNQVGSQLGRGDVLSAVGSGVIVGAGSFFGNIGVNALGAAASGVSDIIHGRHGRPRAAGSEGSQVGHIDEYEDEDDDDDDDDAPVDMEALRRQYLEKIERVGQWRKDLDIVD